MALIGIFGGRFDPPHVGHLGLAQAAIEHFGIDELRVTVVADAGHKRSVAPVEDRVAMARLTFDPLGAVVEREEHAFTADALEAYGYDDPIFLIGADQLEDFPTWERPERVLELARLGVATRPGHTIDERSERIESFEIPPQDVSSTLVRDRARRGEAVEGLVVPAVAAYIAEHGLYRDG
jgi:nicotinate-nucleotide adenylyltransferase